MTEAREVVESRSHTRLEWFGEVYDNGVARSVIVREQVTTIGHPVFGMVDLLGDYSGSGRCQELTIVRRRRIGIDHGDEVLAALILIARPRKQVVTTLPRL